jgi:hypothetical protein
MAARLEHAKRRAEKKPAQVAEETVLPRSVREIDEEFMDEEVGAPLWATAVESLGRSAGVMEELAESTGEAIARIAARGDRIDRIQKETRAKLNALVA